MTLRSDLGSPSSIGDLPQNREMRLINIVMSESFRRRLMETSIPANKEQLENKEVGCKHPFWVDVCKAFNNTDEWNAAYDTCQNDDKDAEMVYVGIDPSVVFDVYDEIFICNL